MYIYHIHYSRPNVRPQCLLKEAIALCWYGDYARTSVGRSHISHYHTSSSHPHPMSSSQNALAQVTDPVQQDHRPTDPSQSAGPERSPNPHEDTTAEAEPLPPEWEERHTPEGRAYYIDHNMKSTTWTRPSLKKVTSGELLPPGWEEWEEWHTSEGMAYYVNRDTKSRIWTASSKKQIFESRLLPPEWEERHTSEGRAYYIDHNTKSTTWKRPSSKKVTGDEPLLLGWEEWHTSEGTAYYVNSDTGSRVWTRPSVKQMIESRSLPSGWETRYTFKGMVYYIGNNPVSTSRILQRIYSFDTSPPDFLHHVYYLIQYDEEEQYLTSLQGPELARLVDFLDKVHPVPSAYHQFTKQTLQALGAIPTTDDLARECINKLQAICGHHAILPSSYIASGQIARVGDGPVALGVIADVWEGTCRSKKVSIKCLRVPTENYQTIKKVRIRYRTSSSRLLKNTRGRCSHSPKRRSSGKG